MPPKVKKEPGVSDTSSAKESGVSGVSVRVPSSGGGVGYGSVVSGKSSIVGTENMSVVSHGSLPSVPSGVSSVSMDKRKTAYLAALSDVSSVSAMSRSSNLTVGSTLPSPGHTILDSADTTHHTSQDISLTSPSIDQSGSVETKPVKKEPGAGQFVQPPQTGTSNFSTPMPPPSTRQYHNIMQQKGSVVSEAPPENVSLVTGHSAVTAASGKYTLMSGPVTTDRGSIAGGTVYESIDSEGSVTTMGGDMKSEVVSVGAPVSGNSAVTGPGPSEDATDDDYHDPSGYDIQSVELEKESHVSTKDTTIESKTSVDPSQLIRPLTRQRRMDVTPLVASQDFEQLAMLSGDAISQIDSTVPDEYTQAVLSNLTGREQTQDELELTPVAAAAAAAAEAEGDIIAVKPKRKVVLGEGKSVQIRKHEVERLEKARLVKKYGGDAERVNVEEQRAARKKTAKKLMGEVESYISTNTSFALATPAAPRYPRLMKPTPTLTELIEYKPTQLELEWNKKLLSHINWIGVPDVNLVSPNVYGENRGSQRAQIDGRDRQLLMSQIPYEKGNTRDVWKGKGKVPIFTVRPAYTEIGLRGTKRKTAREAVEETLLMQRKAKEAREREGDRVARFHLGIKESFSAADNLDSQWLVMLVKVGDALGLGLTQSSPILKKINTDPKMRAAFKTLRQHVLHLASHCTPDSLTSLDDTFLSVSPNSTDSTIDDNLIVPELKKPHSNEDLRQWNEAWQMWARMYVEEMQKFGVTEDKRNRKIASSKSVGDIIKSVANHGFTDNKSGKKVKNELRHPTNRHANLVAVKDILTEDADIRESRDVLVTHFATSDPLPVDRLEKPGDVGDFFELENQEQLKRRCEAGDELYEGSMLHWRRDLAGQISAEFLMPKLDEGRAARGAAHKEEQYIEASWDAPELPTGERVSTELDLINAYDGKLVHQRESTFVFRESATEVRVSYPPKRLELSFAPDTVESRTDLRSHKLTTEAIPGQNKKHSKVIFNWEEDLAKWQADEADQGKREQYEQTQTELKRKYARKERQAVAVKKRRIMAAYGQGTPLRVKEETAEDTAMRDVTAVPPPAIAEEKEKEKEVEKKEEAPKNEDAVGDALRMFANEEED